MPAHSTVTSPVKRLVAVLTSLLLVVGLSGLGTTSARAADPTASLSIQKAASAQTVRPGQTFTYTIQLQCTAGTVNGCVNAKLDDPMPPYITIVGTPTVTGTTNFDVSATTSKDLAVTFTDDLGGGQQGLAPGEVVTVQVEVKVDEGAPPTADGQTLPNTAAVSADNANPKNDTADVTLNVPATLAASTTKTIEPAGGPNTAGSETTATVTGKNNSNVAVNELVISDPVLGADGNPPPAAVNPFTYLEINRLTADITWPEGADTVQVRVYDTTTGTWVDGPVVDNPENPTLPDSVDPSDIGGVQLIFKSTSDPAIPPGASGGVSVVLDLKNEIPEDQLPFTINNNADTTVVDADGGSATSDPASATYRIPPNEIDVSAGKAFDPKTAHAGDNSTVTLTGTNAGGDPLDSMTITEPAPNTPNHFQDGGFTYNGASGNVVFPDGATAGTVTYVCDGTPGDAQDLTNNAPLPDPPADCDPVTGLGVTFTGSISAGAQATVPFGVTTNADQTPEELTRTNTVRVDGDRDGNTGSDTATATIKTIKDRIAVDVGKSLVPSTIPSFPGEIVTAELSGVLLPFPDSTVDATTIIVQDPAQFPDPNEWYDSFNPQAVTATAVPACASMTVKYTTDGETWTPIPGMEDIQGATIFNGTIPDEVGASAEGIQFVYTAAPVGGDCSGGFPPGTTVSPNLSYTLDEDAPNQDLSTITNCAASSGTAATAPGAHSDPACDDIDFVPVDPGTVDPIDKSWDKDSLFAAFAGPVRGHPVLVDGRLHRRRAHRHHRHPEPGHDPDRRQRLRRLRPGADRPDHRDRRSAADLRPDHRGPAVPATGRQHRSGRRQLGGRDRRPLPGGVRRHLPRVHADRRTNVPTTIGFRLTYVESPTRADRLARPARRRSAAAWPPRPATTGTSTRCSSCATCAAATRQRRSPPIRHYNATDDGFVDNTVRLDPYWNVDGHHADPEPHRSRHDPDQGRSGHRRRDQDLGRRTARHPRVGRATERVPDQPGHRDGQQHHAVQDRRTVHHRPGHER